MFNRSRQNLAYWFTLSMGSILILFSAIAYYRDVQDQIQAFDQTLYRKTKVMAARVRYGFYQGRWWVNLADVPLLGSNTISLESDLVYARWYTADGQLVRFVGVPPSRQLITEPGFQTIRIGNRPSGATASEAWLRQVTLPVVKDNLLVGYLQVATPLLPIRERLEQRRLFLTLGVPFTLGLIGLTGWFLGGLALQPIREAYEQLQRFTADASHELRAPLAAVLSNAQVGLLAADGDGTQQRQRLENIVEITKSMSVLLSNLLFLARHAGRLAPEALKTIDLVSLLQPLIEDYTSQAAAQNQKFLSSLPDQPVYLDADPDLLQQAVRNLLNNALKYTPAEGTIQLRLFVQSWRTILQVEDNGIGIPTTDLPHIFERFYRVDTARARQTGGFGLGLSIAQQIIQAHRGQIWATSVVGQGSTFQVELPCNSRFSRSRPSQS